jgi:hypothetical protein
MRKPTFVLVLVFGVLGIFAVSLAQTKNDPRIDADHSLYNLMGQAQASPSIESDCSSGPVVYHHLLMVYPNTENAQFVDKNGVTRTFSAHMSDSLKTTVVNAFKNLPNLISDGSGGVVSSVYDIVEIPTPVTQITYLGIPGYYWFSVRDAEPDLKTYAPKGKYDSVHVLWDAGCCGNGVDSFWGLGGLLINDNTTTISTLITGEDWWWTSIGEALGEPFLHEWLHGVSNYYRTFGYTMPDRDADGADLHGYVKSHTDGWMSYYRDLMQGKVWEPSLSKYTGITAEAWHRGTPNHLCVPGPSITSVSLKGVKNMTILGANFGDTPTVFINGVDKTARIRSASPSEIFLKKKLGLLSGNNEVKVVNSNGSATFIVTL